jgi:hypothetical protein
VLPIYRQAWTDDCVSPEKEDSAEGLAPVDNSRTHSPDPDTRGFPSTQMLDHVPTMSQAQEAMEVDEGLPNGIQAVCDRDRSSVGEHVVQDMTGTDVPIMIVKEGRPILSLRKKPFPRGYTESLEDRVRSQKAELMELKDLLDEKDEKLDLLLLKMKDLLGERDEMLDILPRMQAEARELRALLDRKDEKLAMLPKMQAEIRRLNRLLDEKVEYKRKNPAPQYIEALEGRLSNAEYILRSVLPSIDLDDPKYDACGIDRMWELRNDDPAEAATTATKTTPEIGKNVHLQAERWLSGLDI